MPRSTWATSSWRSASQLCWTRSFRWGTVLGPSCTVLRVQQQSAELAAAASATHAMQPGAEECKSCLDGSKLQPACLCGVYCKVRAKLFRLHTVCIWHCSLLPACLAHVQNSGLSTWLSQLPVCMQSLVLAPLFVWLEFLFALGYRKEYQALLNKRIQADIAASKQQKQPLLQEQANSDGASAAVTTKA